MRAQGLPGLLGKQHHDHDVRGRIETPIGQAKVRRRHQQKGHRRIFQRLQPDERLLAGNGDQAEILQRLESGQGRLHGQDLRRLQQQRAEARHGRRV
ncbi:hypothetical protein GALL_441720 [mine drainage metagenome]|uniref:Uncharacterized protein n=1 Tax=mine drainage metagenome TaxID=410659 RepID=A0A1J5PRR9_9ZZZZ